ncbi:VWA domain-containing protein [Caballeronia sp. GAWG2-1]|uniref:cobaltochelatase CobT-related protein n=1 Tax=Caballeronia sp. GAWG2-1 TaxID=2921744 RepID=UPI0020282D0E|nr:VWA domain-containing protein [Caballeronia sp. GAWG2-1]
MNASTPMDDDNLAKLARTLARRDDLEIGFSPDGPVVRGKLLLLPDTLDPTTQNDTVKGYLDLLVARHCHCDSDALDKTAAGARGIARALDDRRACALLLDAYPGAEALLRSYREHRQELVLGGWQKLSWREQFAWRVERALWNEQATAVEDTPSLGTALHVMEDILREGRASVSTEQSVRLAMRALERIAALSAGDINNMMFIVDHESASEPEYDASSEESTPAHSSAAPLDDSSPDSQGDAIAPERNASPIERPTRSVPLTTEFDRVTDLTGMGDPTAWRKLRTLARAQTGPLKARLERALKADEQTHWQREQERGELDRPSLVRLATSPGYRTPFRAARARPGRDAAVTLLIDRSGSMAGRKIELARLCATALCDALEQLGFACEVLGYSSIEDADMRAYYERWLSSGHTPPEGFNRFVERLDLQVFKRFDSANLSGLARIACGHENPDGEALTWAAERLLARRARRRILMVLSDGYPATGEGHPALLRSDLRERVREVLARKVELIGIGILDDAVEEFYPVCSVVEELQQLPAAAFEVLGQTLLGHREWMLEHI